MYARMRSAGMAHATAAMRRMAARRGARVAYARRAARAFFQRALIRFTREKCACVARAGARVRGECARRAYARGAQVRVFVARSRVRVHMCALPQTGVRFDMR